MPTKDGGNKTSYAVQLVTGHNNNINVAKHNDVVDERPFPLSILFWPQSSSQFDTDCTCPHTWCNSLSFSRDMYSTSLFKVPWILLPEL